MFFCNSILEINFGWWLRNLHTMGEMSNMPWWLEIRMMGRSFGNFSKPLNENFVPKMSKLLIIRKFSISTDFLCAPYPHIFLQITWMGWNTTSRSPKTMRYMGVKRYPSNFTITIFIWSFIYGLYHFSRLSRFLLILKQVDVSLLCLLPIFKTEL